MGSKLRQEFDARQILANWAGVDFTRSDSALGPFYRRLCNCMDKALANTAVAHKLARTV